MSGKGMMTVIIIMLLAGIYGISGGAEKEEQMAKPVNKACDRECLGGFITKYLDAMIAHKPESLRKTVKSRSLEKVYWKIYPV
jgi:hypothetical protein